ncbi:response regulator [Paenibacillus sp. T1]|uniref:Response regulator n=1 Tax=Paenibacillus glycinis TaxID=2697035 RepID=A0ABW9XKB7_9BACL|nr:response regulator [Paenibacillus glycinis]
MVLSEDDETLGALTEHQLKRQYHVVDWMKDGRKAKEALAARRYDIYVLDWMMPDMTGLELVRKISRSEALFRRSGVPIVGYNQIRRYISASQPIRSNT